MKPDFLWKNIGLPLQATDPLKDQDNRGELERFLTECITGDYKENTEPLIANLIANNTNPITAFEEKLPDLSANRGEPLDVEEGNYVFRKILTQILQVRGLRGSLASYQYFINLLGYDDVEITLDITLGRYDSGLRYDSPLFRYDDTRKIVPYTMRVSGSFPSLTSEQIEILFRVDEYCRPYDGRLLGIVYNGDSVATKAVTFRVDPVDGHLYYDNAFDPTMSFEIRDGRLIAIGPNASKYTIIGQNIYFIG